MLDRRDYSLLGDKCRKAVDKGLAAAELHHAEVPRSEMKELMHRKDRHVGHHMFPMIHRHAFPRPHELIKHDGPSPEGLFWNAHRKALPAPMRQLRGRDVLPVRRLPDTARPHRAELHDAVRA